MSSFKVELRRHWLRALLLALVIAESSFLSFQVVSGAVKNLSYGGFEYGCADLVAKPVSNDSVTRTIRLTCPNGPAVILSEAGYCGVRENGCTKMYPTFDPPRGLLALYAVSHSSTTCLDSSHPDAGVLLISGVLSAVYGSYGFQATDLDYCAVTARSVGTLEGFSIRWTLGYGPRTGPSLHFSAPYNVSVAQGSSSMFTLVVTSQNQFAGNISLSPVTSGSGQFPPSLSCNPQRATLTAGSSSSIIVTVQTSPGTTMENWLAWVKITPEYGSSYFEGPGSPYAPVSTGGIWIHVT